VKLVIVVGDAVVAVVVVAVVVMTDPVGYLLSTEDVVPPAPTTTPTPTPTPPNLGESG
jgi:hypothetical protein